MLITHGIYFKKALIFGGANLEFLERILVVKIGEKKRKFMAAKINLHRGRKEKKLC